MRSADRYRVFGAPALGEVEIAEVVATLRSGWIGTGPNVARFQEAFARYVGAPTRRRRLPQRGAASDHARERHRAGRRGDHHAADLLRPDRGDPENRIEELKNDLALDRANCSRFLANQFRVLLTAAAYALTQELRFRARHTDCARAQVGTLRLRLLKLAAWIETSVRRIVIHLPRRFPGRPAWLRIAAAVGGIPS